MYKWKMRMKTQTAQVVDAELQTLLKGSYVSSQTWFSFADLVVLSHYSSI